MPRSSGRRVVVTGLGCVSPLGMDAEASWKAALAGRSGVRPIRGFDASTYPVRFAGEVPEPLELPELSAKEARRLDRVIKLAALAAAEARAAGGLQVDDANRERIGVCIGSGIGGVRTLQEAQRTLFESGVRRVSPFAIPMTLSNMPAGYVAILQGLQGPNLCHVSACSSGAHAIGEAARLIERGDADAVLAGGAEASITEIGIAGFAAMRALSTRNDEPEAASRPFDLDRDGFVMGEGAAVLLLEAREHALARGAAPRAEVLGYARNADAVHVAAPTENAEGAQRCMRLALADAGIGAGEVDYLNAHATSTDLGDASEARAIRSVFGPHAERLAVSSTKSMTGHLLGASGALEALFCVRALETGVLPPTINLERPDPACALDHVANKARRARIAVAVSNSFGFGGTNACLVLARPDR